MVKLSSMQTDPTKEAGTVVEILPGLSVAVKSTATVEYRELQARLLKPLAKLISVGIPIPPVRQDEITATLLSEVAVLGWDGLTDDDDKPIHYSKDAAFKVFSDPQSRQFRDLCFEAASTPETFRVAVRTATEGNSLAA